MQGAAQISARLCWPAVMAVACCILGCAQSVPVAGSSADAVANSTGTTGSTGTTSPGTGTTAPGSTTTATPLSVQGSPATTVVAGTAYAFQPSVAENTTIVAFTIANEPAWASFDPTTGALSGTPTVADVGTTSNITITANDATGTAMIGPFDITVTAPTGAPTPTPPGTATLSWDAPTSNTNGTALTDLAGFHIYYGTSATQLNQEIILKSASATPYVITNLATGTYYFAVTAVSSEGTESAPSTMVSKTI